ncbi:MAG TPA: GNAT family N-acetyltransferase [Bacteroidia bacterium]|nr:GNAT family N-acetyltransferase [Bacteroidia bacterium]
MYIQITQTERLNIRPVTEADIEPWQEFFMDNYALPFFNFDDDRTPLVKSQYWVKRQFKRYEENRMGLMALVSKETGLLIGMCGLLTQDIDNKQEIEVGYHVLPKYWGNGYATEAAQFFKKYAFDNAITERLISIIHPENYPSQNVARKNGMGLEKEVVFHGLKARVYVINK